MVQMRNDTIDRLRKYTPLQLGKSPTQHLPFMRKRSFDQSVICGFG